jgi:hypothetical protein
MWPATAGRTEGQVRAVAESARREVEASVAVQEKTEHPATVPAPDPDRSSVESGCQSTFLPRIVFPPFTASSAIAKEVHMPTMPG